MPVSSKKLVAEKKPRDGSQTNREQLYKRFKKLTALESSSKHQTHSQKNMEEKGPTPNSKEQCKGRNSHTTQSAKQASSQGTHTHVQQDKMRRVANMPCQSPPSHPIPGNVNVAKQGPRNPYAFNPLTQASPTNSKCAEANNAFSDKNVGRRPIANSNDQQQADNKEYLAYIREQLKRPQMKGRNSNIRHYSTSQAHKGRYGSNEPSYCSSLPISGILGEGNTSTSYSSNQNGPITLNLRSALTKQGQASHLMKPYSQTSSDTKHPSLVRSGFHTGQNSQQNLEGRNPLARLRQMASMADKQNQYTISLQSELDLNHLNDSHMFPPHNQRRQQHFAHPPGFMFNQSSVTHNEGLSYSKFEPGAEDLNHSDCSLWLNEELEAAQYENRIRQMYQQQQFQIESASPENSNLNGDSTHLVQQQYYDASNQREQMEARYIRQLSQQRSSESNTGLTHEQKYLLSQKPGQFSNRSHMQLYSRQHLPQQAPLPYNTGRLSHHPDIQSHLTVENSLRANYKGTTQARDNLVSGQALSLQRQREISAQVNANLLRDSLQLKKGQALMGHVSNAENMKIFETSHPARQTSNERQLNSRRASTKDKNHSFQNERAKLSTRTNPYTNLLNSNYLGSTAPSANLDQMTVSQVNSCSQFITGGVHTLPGPQQYITAGTLPMRGGAGPMLENLADTNYGVDRFSEEGLPQQSQASCFDFAGMSAAEKPGQNAAALAAHQAYTTQVAQQLLAQVKPSILKLIQQKIEVIVKELCEEGFCDQRSIMRVLEQRASKLFPENFVLDNTMAQMEADREQLLLTGFNQMSSLPQYVRTEEPTLHYSQVNLSQNELPLDRSIYSDSMLVSRNTRGQIQAQDNEAYQSQTMNVMGAHNKSFEAVTHQKVASFTQKNVFLDALNRPQAVAIEEVAAQFLPRGLNTTEKIINAMRKERSEQEDVDVEDEGMLSVEPCFYKPERAHESQPNQEYEDAPDEGKLNTERLMDQIRSIGKVEESNKGRNFHSRKPQKSEDFKITFAYTSKKLSVDMDQGANGAQGLPNGQVYGLQQDGLPSVNQHQPENLLSFNRNDFVVQSPQLHRDQILQNIRSFTLEKRLSTDRSGSNLSCIDMDHCPESIAQTFAVKQQHAKEDQLQVSETVMRIEDNDGHVGGQDQELMRNEAATLYFQTQNMSVPENHETNEFQSRNRKFMIGATSSQQPSGRSATMTSNLYQRTSFGSEKDSSERLHRHHHYITQNSDLIDQFGGEFIIGSQSQLLYSAQSNQQPQQVYADSLRAPTDACGQQPDTKREENISFDRQRQLQGCGAFGQQDRAQNLPPQAHRTKSQVASSRQKSNPSMKEVLQSTHTTDTANNQSCGQNPSQLMTNRDMWQIPMARIPKQKLHKNAKKGSHVSRGSLSSADPKNPSQGLSYDVRAEGSIINIKRNQDGDHEMLILSSMGELKDDASHHTQISHLQVNKDGRRACSLTKKSKLSRRSRTRSKEARGIKTDAERAPVRPQRRRSRGQRSGSLCPRSISGRIGICCGNILKLPTRPSRNAKSCTPTLKRSRRAMLPARAAPNAFEVSKSARPTHRRAEMQIKVVTSKEPKYLSSVNTPVKQSEFEKEVIKSVKSLRRANFEAKRDLKSIYDHKISKLAQNFAEERQKNFLQFKKQLKIEHHVTHLHKKRAERYKASAEELAAIAENERQKNFNLQKLVDVRRKTRSGYFSSIGRSLSHSRLSKWPGETKQQTIFGPLGVTHKPGFSFISKSLPRSNHHFVNKGAGQDGPLQKIGSQGRRRVLSSLCESAITEVPLEQSLQRSKQLTSLPVVEDHLGSEPGGLETFVHQNESFNRYQDPQSVKNIHSGQVALSSHQTFGRNERVLSMGTNSFEELKRGQKSFFDAATKTLISSSKEQTAEVTSMLDKEPNVRDQKLKDFAVRFQCTSCEKKVVEVEASAQQCQGINCNADQKQRANRQRGSVLSDLSWDSSDLNSEYQNSAKRKSRNERLPNKLLQCSSDLIANKARLDQIQRILFQPKQPRQQSRTRAGRHAAHLDDSYDRETVNLPQMIEKLRRSRQNLKF